MARKAKTAKQAPISTHPVFPAIVALWFAALFGIGSLVLPVVLFEKALTATGLASLSTAMQPPLGPTARIAIAVTCALIGVALGIFLARKVAASQGSTQEPVRTARSAEPRAKKPISAMEELGPEGLDEPIEDQGAPTTGAMPGRRRALAVTDDSGPSDFLETAPLPGAGAHAASNTTNGDIGGDSHQDQEDALELGDFEENEDRGWTEENMRQSQSFGSGSLSMSSGTRFDHGYANAPAATAAPAADTPRPFDGPVEEQAAPQPTAHPAPFAPPPSSPPTPTGAGAARPFDAPPQDAPPAFPAPQAPPQMFAQPVDEPESNEPEPAESPIDELRRHFDAPAAEPEQEPEAASAPIEQAPAPAYNPMADHLAQPEADKPRPAFGMPQPVEQQSEEQAPRPFAMPQEQPTAPAAQAPFAAPQAEPVEPQATSVSEMPFARPESASESQDELQPQFEAAPARPRFEATALAELGMVELVERFALSLQRKQSSGDTSALAQAARELMPSPAPAAPAPEPVAEPEPADDFTPSDKPTVPSHMLPGASEVPPQPAIPAALQPIGLDDDDEDELADDGFAMPLQRMTDPFARPQEAQPAAPEMAEDETDEGEDEDQSVGEGFGSLLAMKSPFAGGREFVRVEEDAERPHGDIEPVVVFPGNEARRAAPASDGPSRDPATAPRFEKRVDSGATEQALRDALAKLQKMSGAA